MCQRDFQLLFIGLTAIAPEEEFLDLGCIVLGLILGQLLCPAAGFGELLLDFITVEQV
jgi:hypothetical protein